MPRILYVFLGSLSLIWGGSFFFIKVLLTHFGPWSIAFLRSGFGIVTILVIMLLLRKPLELRQLPWKPLIIVGLFNTAVPWALIGFSETRVTSSMASVLNATTPLWTMIVGFLLFHIKGTRNQWLGMAVGFCGLLVLLDINPVNFISIDPLGFFGMLAATFFYGLSSHVLKRKVHGVSMYQTALSTLIVGNVASGIVAFGFESLTFVPLFQDPNVIWALLGLGTLGSGVAYILFYHLVQAGSAEFASMVTYLVPVTAILWGYLLLDESIHWTLVAGLGFILSGVFLAGRKSMNSANSLGSNEKSPTSERA